MNDNTKTVNESMQRQLEFLSKAPTIFNILSLVPSETTWVIKLDDMEKYIRDIAAQYLGSEEILFVTIDPSVSGSHRREPQCHVWLNRNSRHFVDYTAKKESGNMLINPTIHQFSNELKRFADQFAPLEDANGNRKNRKKLITLSESANYKDILAVNISLSRAVYRLFDAENRAFTETYGAGTSAPKCNIVCSLSYSKKRNGDNVLSAIRVTKKQEVLTQRRPTPVSSFRDRDRYDDDRGFRSIDDGDNE